MTPMLVQCTSCLTEFALDPDKVPGAGVRARCSVCSAVITVPAPPHTTPAPASADSHSAPAADPQSRFEDEASLPSPSTATQTAPAAPASPAQPAAAMAGSAGWGSRGAELHDAPPAPTPPPAPPPEGADPAQRRPINPFLTRDPALRAKRLARALVSDIVAYHPARHAEGLRDGTLKTLFRDEIKKSYEEYVEQVGRDFASSTTHFQDALNDVLASGKKLF